LLIGRSTAEGDRRSSEGRVDVGIIQRSDWTRDSTCSIAVVRAVLI